MADRKRLNRGLRIAVSAFCGVVCVSLLVLWIGSYRHYECLTLSVAPGLCVQLKAGKGKVIVGFEQSDGSGRLLTHHTHEIVGFGLLYHSKRQFEIFVLLPEDIHWYRHQSFVMSPCWLPVLFFATLTAIPWLPWRFSLRSLFIAFTLAALAMGAIVYFVRQ